MIDVCPFAASDEISFFLKVENQQSKMRFKLINTENFIPAQLFIVDTDNDEYFPILKQDFKIILNPGNYHRRFRLAFRDKRKTEIPDTPPKTELVIFQGNRKQKLKIKNPTKNENSIPFYFQFDWKTCFLPKRSWE